MMTTSIKGRHNKPLILPVKTFYVVNVLNVQTAIKKGLNDGICYVMQEGDVYVLDTAFWPP